MDLFAGIDPWLPPVVSLCSQTREAQSHATRLCRHCGKPRDRVTPSLGESANTRSKGGGNWRVPDSTPLGRLYVDAKRTAWAKRRIQLQCRAHQKYIIFCVLLDILLHVTAAARAFSHRSVRSLVKTGLAVAHTRARHCVIRTAAGGSLCQEHRLRCRLCYNEQAHPCGVQPHCLRA